MGGGFTSLFPGFLHLSRYKEKNVSEPQIEMGHRRRAVGSLCFHHLLGDRKSLALVNMKPMQRQPARKRFDTIKTDPFRNGAENGKRIE